MLVKILSRKTPSYRSLIRYILNEKKSNETNDTVFLHNVRGQNIDDWVMSFMENECYRNNLRKDSIMLYHELISLGANEDASIITDKMLSDIVARYIELRNPNGMYLSGVHRDKDHTHIHILASALEYRTGKSMRLSHDELQTLKIELQEYHKQKYPELTESFCNHGKGGIYVKDRQYYSSVKEARTALKEQLKEQVQSIYAKATSQKEFIELLREQNLHHYERGSSITGILHEDEKFRFSRLGIDVEQLPIDLTEEQIAMQEIQGIREAMQEQSFDEIEDELYYGKQMVRAR